jgi:hypothetical protein
MVFFIELVQYKIGSERKITVASGLHVLWGIPEVKPSKIM